MHDFILLRVLGMVEWVPIVSGTDMYFAPASVPGAHKHSANIE